MKKTIAILFSLLLAMMVFHVAIAAEANDEATPTPIDPIVGEDTVAEEGEPVLILEENETEPVETNETEDEPIVDENATSACDGLYGITPDHPILWGVEKSLERIQELMTFSEEGKINLGLERAQERHCEIIKMMEQKKFEHAEKAKVAYENQLKAVEKKVNSFGNGDVEKDLEKLDALKAKVQAQIDSGDKIQLKLQTKLQTELTAEQKTQLNEMIQSMEKAGYDVKETVKEKQNKVEVKVKAKLEKTDDELKQVRAETETKTRENQPEDVEPVENENENRGNETTEPENKGGKNN